MSGRKKQHKMSRTRTYSIWRGMVTRITNPNDATWKRYGGRGLDMDPRWMQFENFYADMGECPEGLSIERIDNAHGYWVANCRWATYTEQANNTRRNRLLTIGGKTDTLANWARISGVPYSCLILRARRNWPESKILSLLSHNHGHGAQVKPYTDRPGMRLITISGSTKSLSQWARQVGLSPSSFHKRVVRGVSEENLLTPSMRKKEEKQA